MEFYTRRYSLFCFDNKVLIPVTLDCTIVNSIPHVVILNTALGEDRPEPDQLHQRALAEPKATGANDRGPDPGDSGTPSYSRRSLCWPLSIVLICTRGKTRARGRSELWAKQGRDDTSTRTHTNYLGAIDTSNSKRSLTANTKSYFLHTFCLTLVWVFLGRVSRVLHVYASCVSLYLYVSVCIHMLMTGHGSDAQ